MRPVLFTSKAGILEGPQNVPRNGEEMQMKSVVPVSKRAPEWGDCINASIHGTWKAYLFGATTMNRKRRGTTQGARKAGDDRVRGPCVR
jgi:hypothetical protein